MESLCKILELGFRKRHTKHETSHTWCCRHKFVATLFIFKIIS
jgi:hypothetical protein